MEISTTCDGVVTLFDNAACPFLSVLNLESKSPSQISPNKDTWLDLIELICFLDIIQTQQF